MKLKKKKLTKTEIAKSIGAEIAEKAIKKGIKTVVFDRGGFIYHGRIKAFAESAREKGLKFLIMKDLLQKKSKNSADIELKDKLVGVQRVVKVTKGGRAFDFQLLLLSEMKIAL